MMTENGSMFDLASILLPTPRRRQRRYCCLYFLSVTGEPETPFVVTTPRQLMSRTSKARKRSAAFKFAVFDRYRPAGCCVCGIEVAELLDAAHIVGVEHDGANDP